MMNPSITIMELNTNNVIGLLKTNSTSVYDADL